MLPGVTHHILRGSDETLPKCEFIRRSLSAISFSGVADYNPRYAGTYRTCIDDMGAALDMDKTSLVEKLKEDMEKKVPRSLLRGIYSAIHACNHLGSS